MVKFDLDANVMSYCCISIMCTVKMEIHLNVKFKTQSRAMSIINKN